MESTLRGGTICSSCRQSGNRDLRRRLLKKPKKRMRTNPCGSTWRRKRRRNSSAVTVISFFCCGGRNPSSGTSRGHRRSERFDDWRWRHDGCSGPGNEERAADRRTAVSHTRPNLDGRANEERSGMPLPAQAVEDFLEKLTVFSERLSSTQP